MKPLYNRIIIKLSGEALAEDDGSLILSKSKLEEIAKVVSSLLKENVQVAIVTGAGNIFRGRLAQTVGLDRERADYMGMAGTIINAMALEDFLKSKGIPAVALTALTYENLVEKYEPELAKKYLSENKVIIFGAGTGKPFCTTDSCATLRCLEIEADAILMGKNGVEGVYDSDPRKNPNAKFIKEITFKEIIDKNLAVIDTSAAQMLLGSNVVVKIFNMANIDNFLKIVHGENIGTTVKD